MKKLLCGIICASAAVVLADAPTATVSTVDVIEIDSGLKNTVVAVPGLDLSGGTLVISNLVKTTGLTAGDTLYAFDNGKYESWVLEDGHWAHAAQRHTISSTGAVENASTPASMQEMAVGRGIWLNRQDTSKPFYVYAAHVESPSTEVTAGTTVLLGNPSITNAVPRISGAQTGDQILIPTSKFTSKYQYNGSAFVGLKGNLPAIVKGTGFWYKAVSDGSTRTITW